jgi:hypothetical protein
MGSVYKYLPDGRTQRFKVATGELSEPQDTIVFMPSWERIGQWALQAYPEIFKGVENSAQYEALLVHYVHGGNKTIRIVDQTGAEMMNNAQADKAVRVFAALIDKDENGQTMREKHLGNKVVDIKYQE